MKKQLIAIGLASVLTAPSVALAQEEEAAAAEEMAVEEMAAEEMAVEEMAAEAPAGPSVTVYGSFRTGLEFVSGEGASDATVKDFSSRFGLKGSSEVSEGLTASFKLENSFDTATAGIGAGRIGMVGLSGGFGSIALGNMWTASANHYYFAVEPTFSYGTTGGAHLRKARMVSYSSSVGAVSFQIDRHTDTNGTATIEFGASTSAGPVNVGIGYWSTEDYEAKTAAGVRAPAKDTPKSSFTGFAVSSSLAGMNLAIGIGSTDSGEKNVREKIKSDASGTVIKVAAGEIDPVDESRADVSIVALGGSIGDSGVSYGVQMSDADKVWWNADKEVVSEAETGGSAHDPSQTVVNLTSKLGGSASLIFEHVAKKGKAKDRSLVTLKVDF